MADANDPNDNFDEIELVFGLVWFVLIRIEMFDESIEFLNNTNIIARNKTASSVNHVRDNWSTPLSTLMWAAMQCVPLDHFKLLYDIGGNDLIIMAQDDIINYYDCTTWDMRWWWSGPWRREVPCRKRRKKGTSNYAEKSAIDEVTTKEGEAHMNQQNGEEKACIILISSHHPWTNK